MTTEDRGPPVGAPPHELDAEDALLVALLEYPPLLLHVRDVLGVEHFIDDKNKLVYAAICEHGARDWGDDGGSKRAAITKWIVDWEKGSTFRFHPNSTNPMDALVTHVQALIDASQTAPPVDVGALAVTLREKWRRIAIGKEAGVPRPPDHLRCRFGKCGLCSRPECVMMRFARAAQRLRTPGQLAVDGLAQIVEGAVTVMSALALAIFPRARTVEATLESMPGEPGEGEQINNDGTPPATRRERREDHGQQG